MDEHVMYRNQLIKQISTLQAVDVSNLKQQLEASQHEVVHKLYTLADDVKHILVRNQPLKEEALLEHLKPFESLLRGEKLPVVRNTAYDEVLLQGIDTLDRLLSNADPQSITYAQLMAEMNDYLDKLEAASINEIALPHDPYESAYMIAKQDIAYDQVEEGFEVGQVHRVLQRGFIDVETGAILRKASIEIVVAPSQTVEVEEQPASDHDAEQQ